MAIKHEAIVKRGNLYNIDPKQIKVVDGWNKRKDFGDMESLRDSIINHPGVRVPLRIKKSADGEMQLIDGERRLRAVLMAIDQGHDIKSVPCLIEDKNISEIEMMFLQLVTNDGKNFDPVEEAHAFNQLLQWGLSIDKIALKLGKSSVHVRERLVLVNAVPDVAKAISDKKIPIGEGTKIVKESGGSVDKQRVALKNTVQKRAAKKASPKPVCNLERVLKILRIEMKKGQPAADQAQFAEEIHEILNRI